MTDKRERSAASAASTMLLERESELEYLHRLLDDLDSTGGWVVLLRGEAGIGKSALVSRFLAAVADRADILLGFCDDLLSPQPLGPIWDIARHDSSLPAPLDQGDRRAVMEALLELLSRRLRPTVLILEDVQWADEATLDVVRFLGRRIADAHGLLLLTYRDGEVDADHPLRQVIGQMPPKSLTRIRLKPLTVGAVASMVQNTAVSPDEMMALTGGNPLFVTEALASGVEQVPPSVRDSVLARTAKLPPDSRRLLDLVSVFPGGADRDVIDRILAPDSECVADCERPGLLRLDTNTLSFRHELVRRAVESALSDAYRRELNRWVLGELEPHADPAVLVHHAREADAADAIVKYAPKAARAAMAVESHRQAIDNFRTLEPHLHRIDADDRATILADWALVESYLDPVVALDILDRAIGLYRSSGLDRPLASALTFAVRLDVLARRYGAADSSAAEAVALLEAHPPDADLAYAVSQKAWLRAMQSEWRLAVDLADQALGIAEAVGDELAIIHALNTKGTGLCAAGDYAGFAILEESRRRAEQHGFPFEEARALGNMAVRAEELLELEWAMDWARRSREVAARHDLPGMEAHAWAQLATLLDAKGDWAAAEDAANEALASAPSSEFSAVLELARLQMRRGRPEAPVTLDRLWYMAEASGGSRFAEALGAATTLAEYQWLTGKEDPDKAASFPEILQATERRADPCTAGALAFWMWQLGSLAAPPDWIVKPYQLMMTGRATEAAAIWEKKGVPYEQALALMQGDDDHQLQAVSVLEGLGASATAKRVRRWLLDRGVRVPRGAAMTTRRHPTGLTARQAEVLELLADGLTSPQIADRLFLSTRTVENHVAAILMKLDVTDRHAAVVTARHLGLLAPPRPMRLI